MYTQEKGALLVTAYMLRVHGCVYPCAPLRGEVIPSPVVFRSLRLWQPGAGFFLSSICFYRLIVVEQSDITPPGLFWSWE